MEREGGRLIRGHNKDALLVVGHQKSGTTAIAALLAQRAGRSVTLDVVGANLAEAKALVAGEVSPRRFMRRHKESFRTDIIKAPMLSFLYPRFQPQFKRQEHLYIEREPAQVIRSILQRLGLPGTLAQNPDVSHLPKHWQAAFDARWLGGTSTHYVEALAERLAIARRVYEANQDTLHLVRYEDFQADKQATIDALCDRFGWEPLHPIDVDRQYQPKGKPVDLAAFFGDNLDRIDGVLESLQ